MHLHTQYSKDAFSNIGQMIERAKRLGIGLAVTDHNEIDGAAEAWEHRDELLIIPGIEVKARNGVDILVYFYEFDELRRYYEAHILPAKANNVFVPDLSIEDIVKSASGYRCVVAAPHPYAPQLLGLAGVIENGFVAPEILSGVDVIEIQNGSMSPRNNADALAWARSLGKPVSAGSDAHWTSHVGRTVTCAQLRPGEHFLDALQRESATILSSPPSSIVSALIFLAGQCKLLTYPRGFFLLRTHLHVCLSTATRRGPGLALPGAIVRHDPLQ